MDATLMVIAKEPRPGRVKTRLCPPCLPAEAATLAAAALADSLEAVRRTPAARRVLVLDGDPAAVEHAGFAVISQRGEGLGERLDAAFADTGSPALLIGMDTPQVTAAALADALARLDGGRADAVIAPTFDGGYWCIGFRAPVAGAFTGVPMSTETTYRAQLARLRELGLRVAVTDPLCDVDTIEDARRVAAEAPGTAFARAFAGLAPTVLAPAA